MLLMVKDREGRRDPYDVLYTQEWAELLPITSLAPNGTLWRASAKADLVRIERCGASGG